MQKKAIAVLIPCALLLACGQGAVERNPSAEPVAAGPIEVDLVTVLENAADYVGSEVSMIGTVEHVCRHGGKRMFIMGDNPENRLKITAGESIGAFDRTLEGSDVRVTGVVQEQKVDEAYIESREAELSAEGESGEDHEAGEHGDDDHERSARQLAQLRSRMAESDTGTVSFYSLECRSFETLE